MADPRREEWQKQLEGWAVWKSKVIEEWRLEGRQAESREAITAASIDDARLEVMP